MWPYIKVVILLISVAVGFSACGAGLPTPEADLPPQNTVPTATATPTPSPTPPPIPTSDTHRAAVSFGEGTPIGDAELLALLVKHNVKGLWAHIEVYEYRGSSRPFEATEPETFVSTIREELKRSFSPASIDHGRILDARNLANQYNSQELAVDAVARAKAKEFLRSYAAATRAQEHVYNGGPVIYSVIVVGTEGDLRRLGAEERVQDFNIATTGQPWFVWPPFATPTPTPSGVGGQSDTPTATPTPTPLPPQALYDQILAYATRDVPGQPPFQTPTPMPTTP